MGEKEQGSATARETGSGMASGIAIEEEGVQRSGQPLGSAAYARGAGLDPDPGPAAATNLNSSRSNVYRTGGGGVPASDEGDSEDAARLSTNMTIERQTPKRDFGD